MPNKSLLPPVFNPSGQNPALMTLQEYIKAVNPRGKSHDSSAYDEPLKGYDWIKKDKYPHLLKRIKKNGIEFEFRLQAEENLYNKYDTDDNLVRDANGVALLLTPEEIKQKKLRKYRYSIAVFNEDDQCVASSSDEWGTMLIMVAQEYRKFGLGTILGKLARHFEPMKNSGGFTINGLYNFVRVHREMVREALTTGLYNQLVREGKITVARVREILASAKLENKPKQDTLNLSTNDPNDWLLLVDESCFIVYDKKLKDIYQDYYYEWGEKFIKAFGLLRFNHTRNGEAGIVVRFGGDTNKLKTLILACFASYCADENVPFYVDEEDLKYLDPMKFEIGKINLDTGYKRAKVKIKNKINVKLLGASDKIFRRTFDKYSEFHNTVLALADSKYPMGS